LVASLICGDSLVGRASD